MLKCDCISMTVFAKMLNSHRNAQSPVVGGNNEIIIIIIKKRNTFDQTINGDRYLI